MAPSAPLQLLFEQSLPEFQQQLVSLVESSPGLSLDWRATTLGGTAILQKDALGFQVGWIENTVSLSGYRTVFVEPNDDQPSTIMSVDLGYHIAGGERAVPIAQALLALGAELAAKLCATAVIWNPGKLVSDAKFFVESVENYSTGGPFPVLVTVDIDYSDDEHRINSRGLKWFSGQEIELSGCGFGGQQLVRRAVRIVHDIATNGAVVLQQWVPDLDEDKVIELVPGQIDEYLRCNIKSRLETKVGASTLQ